MRTAAPSWLYSKVRLRHKASMQREALLCYLYLSPSGAKADYVHMCTVRLKSGGIRLNSPAVIGWCAVISGTITLLGRFSLDTGEISDFTRPARIWAAAGLIAAGDSDTCRSRAAFFAPLFFRASSSNHLFHHHAARRASCEQRARHREWPTPRAE